LRFSLHDVAGGLCQFDQVAHPARRLLLDLRAIFERAHGACADVGQAIQCADPVACNAMGLEETIHQQHAPTVGQGIGEYAVQPVEQPGVGELDAVVEAQAIGRQRIAGFQPVRRILEADGALGAQRQLADIDAVRADE
jgi:hypothetical protein